MRESDPSKPVRLQQQKVYQYNGKDVYRSWISVPSFVLKQLGWQKGDEITFELILGGVLLKKKELIPATLEIHEGTSGTATAQIQIS